MNARLIPVSMEHVLTASTTILVIVMQIMVAKTVQWSSQLVCRRPAETTALASLTLKTKLNTNSTAHARTDFSAKFAKLSAQ